MTLKTKEIICKIFKTLELWSLWSLRGRHKPEAGGFCLDLPLIIRRRVKDFAAGSGVRHCRIWRYDLLFVSTGEFLAGQDLIKLPGSAAVQLPPFADVKLT
jgi:hypothetical protein